MGKIKCMNILRDKIDDARKEKRGKGKKDKIWSCGKEFFLFTMFYHEKPLLDKVNPPL